jgi:RimJ/RimL family protein N-acetyltransferase
MPISHSPTDLELLELRADRLGDGIIGSREVTLLRTHVVDAFRVGSGVPPELARAVEATRERAPAACPPAPAELDAYERLLTEAGWNVQRDVGLVYLIEPELTFDSDAAIRRSDEAWPLWMRAANPGGWHPAEWNELLDGCLGPWTMAVEGNRIVSICHTPSPLTDRKAECGVWTAPEFRRRGYAAAVTAEWAALLRPSGRHLFYRTDLQNHSSQRVAQRLQLRLLGYQCEFCAVSEEEERHVHPLSQLRSNARNPVPAGE